MASPSPRRRNKPAMPAPAPAPLQPLHDWAALPHDILYAVFLKLGQRETMLSAEFVCSAWRRVAVDEPALWRRVDMATCNCSFDACLRRYRRGEDPVCHMPTVRAAVVAFSGPVDDDLLLHLVERAPLLKSIFITQLEASNEVLNIALKKLPLLEDLGVHEITRWSLSLGDYVRMFECVCQTCPHLKMLTLSNMIFDIKGGISETYEIPLMCKLRSLKLFASYLDAKALSAILDSCPLLEYLEVTGKFYGATDELLQEKCGRVKNLLLPDVSDDEDSDEDFDDFWNI